MSPISSVTFHKVQGSGNDFVCIDNRSLKIPVDVMSEWARRICRRAFGVAADGIFFLENPPSGRKADFIWHFYNADGSRAEMCGNASRCAARMAYELGLAGTECVLGTDAGDVTATYFPEKRAARVRLTPPTDFRYDLTVQAEGETFSVQFVNTGVPHAVIFVPSAKDIDIRRFGRALRFHPAFQPAGTNVNFAEVLDDKHMLLRTYERGVEDETYACGTGSCAAVALAAEKGLTGPEVEVIPTGGETLTITYDKGELYLLGPATKVFKGKLYLESVGLSL